MSAELDDEIRKLSPEDLIQSIRNLNGLKAQLGETLSSMEVIEFRETKDKLLGFLLDSLHKEDIL